MRRHEAASLSASRREGVKHQRPQAENPNSDSLREQQISHEWKNFSRNMADAAFEYERKTGRWPEQRWFDDHRGKFQRIMDRTYPDRKPRSTPPCKNWRARIEVDSVMLSVLDDVWASMIQEWARLHGYLGSPSAACECGECSMEPGEPEMFSTRTPKSMDH